MEYVTFLVTDLRRVQIASISGDRPITTAFIEISHQEIWHATQVQTYAVIRVKQEGQRWIPIYAFLTEDHDHETALSEIVFDFTEALMNRYGDLPTLEIDSE
jgi:hypothetical protein